MAKGRWFHILFFFFWNTCYRMSWYRSQWFRLGPQGSCWLIRNNRFPRVTRGSPICALYIALAIVVHIYLHWGMRIIHKKHIYLVLSTGTHLWLVIDNKSMIYFADRPKLMSQIWLSQIYYCSCFRAQFVQFVCLKTFTIGPLYCGICWHKAVLSAMNSWP